MGKFTAVKEGNSVHLIPALDVIIHACSDKCPCRPTSEPDTGSGESVFTHRLKYVKA